MVVIGAGFSGDVDLARLAAELGWVDAALHLELLERVDRGELDVQVEIDVGVGNAVQSVVIPRTPHACDRDVLRSPCASLAPDRLVGGLKAKRHAWAQGHQL